MDLGLKNKVAFIGGSSQGLGKSVALELSKEGADVIICGRNKETLENTRKEIEKLGTGQVLALVGDLSKAIDCEKMIKQVLKHFKKVDILVTNSGGPPSGKFEELHAEDWQKTFELLLGSTVMLIKGFIPGMKEQRSGRIIMITSQAVKQPVANLILSNSVRASVVGLMKTLASELGSYNITVNNVMPGYTKTNRLTGLLEKNPEMKKVKDEIPLQRFANPEEFAAAVAFLASKRASYITGVSLPVDGGWIKSV